MNVPIFRSRDFYRERLDARGQPEPWTLDDLEDFAARHDDPFGGRGEPGVVPPVALQVEATGEPPVWLGLDGRELDAWARGLAGTWGRFGLRAGETIAFFEYGSSPLVLLASSSYVGYLRRGAADRLGAAAICNDGVALLAARMVSIVVHVAPAAVIVRRDLLAPFADALRTAGVPLAGTVRWVGVTEPEGLPPRRDVERFAEEWEVPLHRFLRADAAHLVAAECDACGLVHVDPRLYRIERARSEVAVTTRFARVCPTVRYSLGPGDLRPAGCEREAGAARLALD